MIDLIDRTDAIIRACSHIKDDKLAQDVREALQGIPSVASREDPVEIKRLSRDLIGVNCHRLTSYIEPMKLSNNEWVDLLAEQFDISRTSAKEMLHGMMKCKAMDNFKKQFSGRGR